MWGGLDQAYGSPFGSGPSPADCGPNRLNPHGLRASPWTTGHQQFSSSTWSLGRDLVLLCCQPAKCQHRPAVQVQLQHLVTSSPVKQSRVQSPDSSWTTPTFKQTKPKCKWPFLVSRTAELDFPLVLDALQPFDKVQYVQSPIP